MVVRWRRVSEVEGRSLHQDDMVGKGKQQVALVRDCAEEGNKGGRIPGKLSRGKDVWA